MEKLTFYAFVFMHCDIDIVHFHFHLSDNANCDELLNITSGKLGN